MSESSQPTSSKRPREDDTEASSSARAKAKKTRGNAAKLVHDEEFWYEDGTIVLVARNVEFRVYKGILADHSLVFADMFSLPQPTSSNAATPDTPSVHLEDSPEDLRHVLRALLPKKSATFVQFEAVSHTFHVISAYIRLGHKYQIDPLFDQSLSYLKKCFTTDLEARQKWLNDNSNQVPRGWGTDRTSKVFAIGVVNLARLAQCDQILPSALAVCCSLSAEQLLHGFVCEDGTRERLSEDDVKLCFAGVRSLTHGSSAAAITALASSCCDECKTPAVCQEARQELLHDHADDSLYFPTDSPFKNWDHYMAASWDAYGACGDCWVEIKGRFRAAQRRLWAELPYVFDLTVEGWPVDEP